MHVCPTSSNAKKFQGQTQSGVFVVFALFSNIQVKQAEQRGTSYKAESSLDK